MNKNVQLNKRQDQIRSFLKDNGPSSVSEVFGYLREFGFEVAKITVKRDLRKMVDMGLILAKGAGPALVYDLSFASLMNKEIDVEEYFAVESDKREIKQYFNFDIFEQLGEVFTNEERKFLDDLNKRYQSKAKKLPQEILKKEFERLTIELSWKSSKIEGNMYSLLETEQLIAEHREAKGHSKEEAAMILNHKKTLDYLRSHVKQFTLLSVKRIIDVHALLVDGLNISKNLRKILVRIIGTAFRPLDNEFQIKEALEKTVKVVNKEKNPFEKAVLVMLLTAYIQPFVDGNKRTSRLMGNAVLLAYDCCPLSYRSIDELEYKKAVLLFYEQNNMFYFKKLFLEQYEFVVENYFG